MKAGARWGRGGWEWGEGGGEVRLWETHFVLEENVAIDYYIRYKCNVYRYHGVKHIYAQHRKMKWSRNALNVPGIQAGSYAVQIVTFRFRPNRIFSCAFFQKSKQSSYL